MVVNGPDKDDVMASVDLKTVAGRVVNLRIMGPTHFRSIAQIDSGLSQVFGGQLIGQSIRAASLTVDDWSMSSCAAQFLRRGMVDSPIDFYVELVRDGHNTANRRVLAYQNDLPMFDMQCTFSKDHDDYERQNSPANNLTGPDDLADLLDLDYVDDSKRAIMEVFFENMGIQMRPLYPEALFHEEGVPSATSSFYFRLPSAESFASGTVQQALLGYLSDFWLGGVTMLEKVRPHTQSFAIASMNHAMWLHAPVRAEEWLLVEAQSPWAGKGRGLANASLFRLDGQLIANYAQEVRIKTLADPDA